MSNDVSLKAARVRLREYANESDVEILKSFFKTGPGEYGEGDRFLGVRVPATRRVALEFSDLPLSQTLVLLGSGFHEERLLALLILIQKYRQGTQAQRKEIYGIYLMNAAGINNWDLVDLSAYHIVGEWLNNRSRRPLYSLAGSRCLWERRIAIIATFHFIRKGDFADTLKIAEMLIGDSEDLIHKATGWMLREIGKRDMAAEEGFLKKHCKAMPRTMLRYAIEKFPESIRQKYLRQ